MPRARRASLRRWEYEYSFACATLERLNYCTRTVRDAHYGVLVRSTYCMDWGLAGLGITSADGQRIIRSVNCKVQSMVEHRTGTLLTCAGWIHMWAEVQVRVSAWTKCPRLISEGGAARSQRANAVYFVRYVVMGRDDSCVGRDLPTRLRAGHVRFQGRLVSCLKRIYMLNAVAPPQFMRPSHFQLFPIPSATCRNCEQPQTHRPAANGTTTYFSTW